MMKKLVLIAAVLGFSACGDEMSQDPAPPENIARTLAETNRLTANKQILPATVDEVLEARRRLERERIDICDLRPQDGPCAFACDINSLGKEFVQPGGCGLFLCENALGEPVKVGACNNP